MKIAQVPPLYESVPPLLYGGTERVVAHLTEALVELGHEVTLFAAADAQTSAELVPVRDCSLRLDSAPLRSDLASHLVSLFELRRRQGEFDIIHFHIDLLHFPFFEEIAGRTVTTLHGRLDLKDLAGVYRRWPGYPLVSVSHDQRRALPCAGWRATIPHGLRPSTYAFEAGAQAGDGYLAFIGRISPEKRLDRAIAIATAAGLPLRVAAKVDKEDREYFESAIRPLLANPLVHFLGEIGDAEKGQFLGRARALLFPIDWPEPFGLVMIEAMACGTPVIAWRCGSVTEVVDEGITGFVVDNMQQAVEAVSLVHTIDRQAVRRVFENRFAAMVMAKRYMALYETLLANPGDREAALTNATLP